MSGFEFIVVLFITFVISTITLLTGFGVGTVLTPTFTLFYDVKTAVFLVAVVHLANNLFKYTLFAKYINKQIFFRFGLVSLLGAVLGSLLQGELQSRILKAFLGAFLLIVGVSEFLPQKFVWRLPKTFDPIGGFFSGLLGGLIGNQGAIRSAYLLNYNLSKETFIATATSIAIVIDLSRIPIYIYHQAALFKLAAPSLLIVTAVAFAGTFMGKNLLGKISLERFRAIVAAFLVLMGLALLV